MKSIKYIMYLGAFTLFLLLSSCGTYTITKTADFKKNMNLDSLQGEYYAHALKSKKLTYDVSFFDLMNNWQCESDYFSLKFISENELKVTFREYKIDSIVENEIVLKGKRKKRYFETYLSKKQFFIPFMFGQFAVDRLRIGFDKSNRLMIRNLYDNTGYLLFIGGGTSGDRKLLFENVEQCSRIRPFENKNKWGYVVKNDTIISATYDYAKAMIENRGMVKTKDKWGLIDNKGNLLSKFEFDKIEPINESVNDSLAQHYFIYKNTKIGILNSEGKITIPVIYENIKRDNNLFKLEYKNKIGFCNLEEVIIPAIYTNVSYFIYEFYSMVQAERNNKIYFIDVNGFEYQSKPNPGYYKIGAIENGNALIPDYSSKRKILIDEQFE